MKIRTLFTLTLIGGIIIVTALFVLNRPQPEMVVEAAIPAPVRASVSTQATTVEQVVAPVAAAQELLYDNQTFGYRLNYPAEWQKQQPSANVVIFQSADLSSQVKIEAVGPLPPDGLTPFVDRSLGPDILISRLTLTINGLPAERVIAFSDAVDGQVTSFYVDAGQCAYVITGVGEQKAIEQVARSFTATDLVAQR